MSKRKIIIGGLVVFVGLAAIGAAAGGAEAEPTDAVATIQPADEVEATSAPADEVAATEEPAAEAPEGGSTATIGNPVQIDDNLTVTVTDAKWAKSIDEYQKPAKGYVYVALKVKYESKDSEVLVNSADWNVLADGERQGQWTIVMNDKWEPSLTFDTLAAGATTEGWMTFEVPAPKDSIEVRFENDLFSDEPQLTLDIALDK